MKKQKKQKYNFDIIFKKLSELKDAEEEIISCDELSEFQEINKLREIVLDISGEDEQYFSTA